MRNEVNNDEEVLYRVYQCMRCRFFILDHEWPRIGYCDTTGKKVPVIANKEYDLSGKIAPECSHWKLITKPLRKIKQEEIDKRKAIRELKKKKKNG